MKYPEDLKYTGSDEWVRVEDGVATIGISDFAQDQLSDIVYLEYVVSAGDTVAKGDTLGTIESVKAASDISLPVGGEVLETNEGLLDAPETVNTDPYGEAWMVKVKLADESELDGMMDAAAYSKSAEERS